MRLHLIAAKAQTKKPQVMWNKTQTCTHFDMAAHIADASTLIARFLSIEERQTA